MIGRPAHLRRPGVTSVAGPENCADAAHGRASARVHEGYTPEIIGRSACLPRPGVTSIRGADNAPAASHHRAGIRIQEGHGKGNKPYPARLACPSGTPIGGP